MVHLAGNCFIQALWRQVLYLLIMVLIIVSLQDDYHSKFVHAKEETAAVVAGAYSSQSDYYSDSRLDPVSESMSMAVSLNQPKLPAFPSKRNTATKKPKYSSSSLSSSSLAYASNLLAANTAANDDDNNNSPFTIRASGEPKFEAQIQMDPNDPCYNFTVGNEKVREFYSPNFPNNYPNDTECERVIRAPHGHQISIEFRDQFHLEDATTCEYDYLEIRDGAYGYSTPLAKLCGPDFPRDITSNDRYLFLRFVSDDSIEYQGFRAVYSFKKMPTERPEPPHECRFNETGVSGIIHNGQIPIELTNYSITQDVSIDCMWNITVAQGLKMYINFKEYKLSSPNNCEANYIDIYGDKLSDLGRKQRFCGTQAEPVRSDGNHMNIRFFAKPDALNNVQFEITFTAFRELPNKEKCRKDEFDCEDSTCIDTSLRCDGVDNCKYRYDEDKQTTCAPGNKGVLNLNSQHMVVILIVFCALVFGMCASITISCWSKIEERRQRKREYKMRHSRETSMEGGLNRTMTITSLDRSTTGCVLEHVEQASSSSGSRCRKIITANAIRHKNEMVDDEVMDGPSMAYYDSEENGCYVPDMDMASMHHHPASTHHHLIYPPSAERRAPQNGGTSYNGHHLDSGDKYSPDTPTLPQMIMGSPNGPGGGQSPLVAGEYYQHQQQHQQNQMERDSIRSGSECSIPPPPPPPALSHFRNRMQQQQQQQQQQQPQFRTVPLDASKLSDPGIMMMGDNHQQTMPYRHPQHMQQRIPPSGQLSLSQQQLILHHQQPVTQQSQQPHHHHPDCAQHQLNKMPQNAGPDQNYNSNSLRRNNGDTGDMLNVVDVDDIGIIDEADENGIAEHHRSTMELNDEGLEGDMFSENEIYPSTNGRLPSTGPSSQLHHQPQQQHYLMRAQSTLDEEEDSANSVPLNSTNSNAGYNSMTPSHQHRQPYYRSEAVIEMGAGGGSGPGGVSGMDSSVGNPNGNSMRQGVAIMR